MGGVSEDRRTLIIMALIEEHVAQRRVIAAIGGPYEDAIRTDYDRRLRAAASAVVEVTGFSSERMTELDREMRKQVLSTGSVEWSA